MAAFLTNEAKLFESLSLKGGVLKKKELLQALLLAEELFENELFVRNLLKEEAKNLAFIIDKLSLCYFRAEEGEYPRTLLLELAKLTDKVLLRAIIRKYS